MTNWKGIGVLALMVVVTWILNSNLNTQSYNDCLKDSLVCADKMVNKCGYQLTSLTEMEQKQCLIDEIKGGDTVDDCQLFFAEVDRNKENQKTVECYLTLQK